MCIFVIFIKLIKKSVENLNKIFFKVSKTVSQVSIVKIIKVKNIFLKYKNC